MPTLWEKIGDAKDNSGLQPVDLSKLAISGPTVIYFPGRDSIDDYPDELSKGLNYVKGFFSGQPEQPQVYSWSHSKRYSTEEKRSLGKTKGLLSTIFNVALYNRFPNRRCEPALKGLAKALIMPLVTNAEGRPLTFGQAQKNLRNLTFFGFCVGTIVAQEFYNASMKEMKKAGYSSGDARKLLHEIVLVTIGTYSHPRKERDRYTTVSLANSDDVYVRTKNRASHPLRTVLSLRGIFVNAGPRLKIKPLSDTSIVVTAAARGKKRDRNKEPEEVIDNVRLPRWDKKASNHEPVDYVNNNYESSQFAGIVPHAMTNAVYRTTALTPMDLLKPPATLGPEERAFYQNKIANAVSGKRKRNGEVRELSPSL